MFLDGTTKLDKGLIKWIVLTASANRWRVDNMSIDDLIQEGFLCYVKCRNHYQGHTCNRRHFMSLVQTTFKRRLIDLSALKRRQVTVPFSALAPTWMPDEMLDSVLLRYGASPATEPEIIEAAVTFTALPSELKSLFMAFLNDDLPAFERRGKRGRRETTHEYHCRLVGADPDKFDLSMEGIHRMIT
jgi:DNA-directed RNA polymerase specialized sigma24 family protein